MILYVVRRYSDELQKDKDKILNILGQVSELSEFPNETGVLLYLPRSSFLGELILRPILSHNKDGFLMRISSSVITLVVLVSAGVKQSK